MKKINIFLFSILVTSFIGCDSSNSGLSSKDTIPSQFLEVDETFDDEAMLAADVTQDEFLVGLSAIRMQGNTCDTISSVALMSGGGVRFRCNNFTLKYEVMKEDGKFIVN